jgi:signal transduction histidine kinase/ActR/RegA family two-component response regulator
MSGDDFQAQWAAEKRQHQQTQEQLQAVLNALPGTVSWFTSDLTYLGVNQRLAQYCNLSPDDFQGKALGFLNPEGNQFTQFAQHFLAGPQASDRMEIMRGDATFLTIAQKYDRGNAALFIEIDISEQKAIAIELAATNQQLSQVNQDLERVTQIKDEILSNMTHIHAELSRATRLKDEFLANMSHELRTPLNAVLGMAEALLDGICGDLSGRQQQAIQTISQSGYHLLALINDILNLAKIDAGQVELLYQSLTPIALVQPSLDSVQPLAAQKQIVLQVTIDPAIVQVRVDERQFRQVLINLLSNAVKFTLPGGQVQLEVSPIGVDQIRFVVADNGIGIAPEHLSQLFEPFIQIDSQLNRQYEGTGIGLALVGRIVALHQGRVTVESQLALGSRFIVEGPWHCQEGAIVTQAQSASAAFLPASPPIALEEAFTQPRSILLAEDNPLNRLLFSEYLQMSGYRVIFANNGQEVLDQIAVEPVDLILMDIQMPVLDGFTVMQQLRQEKRFAHLPIIALTALAMPSDRQRCLAAGATDYLPKPLQLKQLMQRIQHYLQPQAGACATPDLLV